MNAELVLLCQRCGSDVEAGYLWVSHGEITTRAREAREWDQEHAGQAMSLTEMLGMPEDVHWRVHHHGCTPEPADPYGIDVDQIGTWQQLAHWTAHLMEKTWFQVTDWDLLLREVAGEAGTSRRIAPRLRSVA